MNATTPQSSGSNEIILNFVFAIIPVFGHLFKVKSTIQQKRQKARKAKLQQSKYYGWFYRIIVLPLWLCWLSLIVIVLACVFSLFGGVLKLSNSTTLFSFIEASALIKALSNIIITLFDYAWVTLLIYVVLAILVSFDVILYFALCFSGIIKSVKSSPGWINAYWFLNNSANYPMKLDETYIDRLADSILEDIKLRKANAIKFQAPFPCSKDDNSKANYLLFLCSIENCVHIYDNKDTGVLHEFYTYFENFSCLNEDIFSPRNLNDLYNKNENFYEYLLNLSQSFQSPSEQKGMLPNKMTYSQDINETFRLLMKSYDGNGSRMAYNEIGQCSPDILSDNLKSFKRMKGDSIRDLYYKLSRRNNIWPKFSKYPFKYFFNNGIAIILLNSHCIKVDNDKKEIQKDDHFVNLVYKAESEVVEVVFNRLKNDMGSSVIGEINQFFQANFNINLNEATPWQITDVIDLWFFNHARSFCLMDDKRERCPLKDYGSCCCADEYHAWKLTQHREIIRG